MDARKDHPLIQWGVFIVVDAEVSWSFGSAAGNRLGGSSLRRLSEPGRWRRKSPLDMCGACNTFVSMKTAAVHSRIDPETKQKAETILQRLGMSPTEAIRLFYTQITLRNGLPFSVEIPNETTEQALEDSRSGRNLERFDSADALIDSWN